jgi:hypothetical protein
MERTEEVKGEAGENRTNTRRNKHERVKQAAASNVQGEMQPAKINEEMQIRKWHLRGNSDRSCIIQTRQNRA